MATYSILATSSNYYTILVAFGDTAFEQLVISNRIGDSLNSQLQEYSDTLEADYSAAQNLA